MAGIDQSSFACLVFDEQRVNAPRINVISHINVTFHAMVRVDPLPAA